VFVLAANTLQASIAYGTINNFDTVNDTSNVCHGFEIELDDCRSQDITYCYSYNHYGTPGIRQDTTSVPGHTNCFVRYAAVYSNGVWSAYTAIPTGPIAPTLGHSFTNPGTNFGGEHFGVGFYGNPSSIKYNWLLDDGTGNLVHGPAVLVSTPVFTYYPPAAAVPAQIQAVVEPPQVEVQPVEGFGAASWVKSIKTATHTNSVIQLRNLISDDPGYPNDKTWRNGETSEVESEFDLLQQEFGSSGGGGHGGGGGGGGGSLSVTNAPEDLPAGDEIITRRYEFYAYVGPTDPTTHEALAKKVGPDGLHGINQYSNTIVVGAYLGAQMSAYKNELPIGLTENIADGQINAAYPVRNIVIAGIPFTCTNSGTLPAGMNFDPTTGQLSGTPTEAGLYTFRVRVAGTNQPTLEHAYTFAITAANEVLPPHSTVDTVAYPLDSGDTIGLGLYTNGDTCTVTAVPRAGFRFSGWADNDTTVSTNSTYQFVVGLNRSLVANFIPGPPNEGLDLTDPAQALSDLDGDEFSNLMEYALGTDVRNPADAQRGMVISVTEDLGNHYLSLQFNRRLDSGGLALQYVPEVSTDKQNWFPDGAHVLAVTQKPADSLFDLVTVRDLTPITAAAARFMRLRVIASGIQTTSPIWVGTESVIAGNGGSGSKLSLLSQRMVRPLEYAGKVSDLSGATLTDTNGAWTDLQFGTNGAPAYIEFHSGWMVDIAHTSAATQSLTLAQSPAGGASVGDNYGIRSHFTVASLFGTNNETGLIAGPNPSTADNILLLIPETQRTLTLFFYSNSAVTSFRGWVRADTFTPDPNEIVHPQQGVMVRRISASDAHLYLCGPIKPDATVVPVQPGYNLLGTLRSLGSVTLSNLNLFTGDSSTGLVGGLNPSRSDNLIVVEPNGAVATYFYFYNPGLFQGWVSAGGFAVSDDVQIPAGSAFFINRQSAGRFNWTIPAQ
jgi:hypothetical protein